jgi:hypothetical protein
VVDALITEFAEDRFVLPEPAADLPPGPAWYVK